MRLRTVRALRKKGDALCAVSLSDARMCNGAFASRLSPLSPPSGYNVHCIVHTGHTYFRVAPPLTSALPSALGGRVFLLRSPLPAICNSTFPHIPWTSARVDGRQWSRVCRVSRFSLSCRGSGVMRSSVSEEAQSFLPTCWLSVVPRSSNSYLPRTKGCRFLPSNSSQLTGGRRSDRHRLPVSEPPVFVPEVTTHFL